MWTEEHLRILEDEARDGAKRMLSLLPENPSAQQLRSRLPYLISAKQQLELADDLAANGEHWLSLINGSLE